MPNERFNHDFFWSYFSPKVIDAMMAGGEDVYSFASPYTVLAVEHIRNGLLQAGALTGPIPSHLFAFSRGSSTTRLGTRVGGIPYRPRDVRWPMDETGEAPVAYRFLAQFDFCDSREIVGKIPGDMLLIFAKNEGLSGADAVRMEWWMTDIPQKDLLAAEEMPEPSWHVPVLQGELYCTSDYLHCRSRALENMFISQHLKVVRGTKIGGLSSAHDVPSGKRHLCQLAAVSPQYGIDYPWCNVQKPLEFQEACRESLSLVDNGLLSIFIDDASQLTWTFDYS